MGEITDFSFSFLGRGNLIGLFIMPPFHGKDKSNFLTKKMDSLTPMGPWPTNKSHQYAPALSNRLKYSRGAAFALKNDNR